MTRLHLLHWNQSEAEERAERLRGLGYEVDVDVSVGPDRLKRLRDNPPAAVVIDLSRLPSHGRDAAASLRQYRATRTVPVVFVGGLPDKVERTRITLPDATYTSWERIAEALGQAIANPPADPVVPESALAGYSGTPLPKKLGVKPGFLVGLVGAPTDFVTTLGSLPPDAELVEGAPENCCLLLWFVRSIAELEDGMPSMAPLAAPRPMWIIWPKQTSPLAADVTERHVRAAGLAAGLVDYKVCAVDATWSGLLFRRRKT